MCFTIVNDLDIDSNSVIAVYSQRIVYGQSHLNRRIINDSIRKKQQQPAEIIFPLHFRATAVGCHYLRNGKLFKAKFSNDHGNGKLELNE